jgi:hypothetical protein
MCCPSSDLAGDCSLYPEALHHCDPRIECASRRRIAGVSRPARRWATRRMAQTTGETGWTQCPRGHEDVPVAGRSSSVPLQATRRYPASIRAQPLLPSRNRAARTRVLRKGLERDAVVIRIKAVPVAGRPAGAMKKACASARFRKSAQSRSGPIRVKRTAVCRRGRRGRRDDRRYGRLLSHHGWIRGFNCVAGARG